MIIAEAVVYAAALLSVAYVLRDVWSVRMHLRAAHIRTQTELSDLREQLQDAHEQIEEQSDRARLAELRLERERAN
jgi:hypothetical protein